jgi:hypothetical protein
VKNLETDVSDSRVIYWRKMSSQVYNERDKCLVRYKMSTCSLRMSYRLTVIAIEKATLLEGCEYIAMANEGTKTYHEIL